MKFTETESAIKGFVGAKTAEYQLQYIAAEVKDLMSQLNSRYVEYLTNDIIESGFKLDIKNWLGNKYYGSSNENAKECIELCISVKHLYGRKVKAWTDNSLKCYDNFLLKYIQEDCKEKIKKNIKVGTEREVYWHLIEKGGDFLKIGQAFDCIYQERNEFHHIQIVENDGYRYPKPMTNTAINNKRDLIMEWLRTALMKLLYIIEKDT